MTISRLYLHVSIEHGYCICIIEHGYVDFLEKQTFSLSEFSVNNVNLRFNVFSGNQVALS